MSITGWSLITTSRASHTAGSWALSRTIASLAAGLVQMLVRFPMEKFVLLKEKKKDEAEVQN